MQLFRERLSEKMYTWQSRKVTGVWSIHCSWHCNEGTFLLSFSTRKHAPMASRVIHSNFFEEQWTQKHPQYLSGLSRSLLPTAFLETAVYCLDLPTSRAQIFSRARSESGRFFYVFCSKNERRSEGSSFVLGPTTGTGNEKRRTLRKSLYCSVFC